MPVDSSPGADAAPSGFQARIGLAGMARRTLGISMLMVTVFLWTISNFMASFIFADDTYSKPFFVVYINTSAFAVSLIPMAIKYTAANGIPATRRALRELFRGMRRDVQNALARASGRPEDILDDSRTKLLSDGQDYEDGDDSEDYEIGEDGSFVRRRLSRRNTAGSNSIHSVHSSSSCDSQDGSSRSESRGPAARENTADSRRAGHVDDSHITLTVRHLPREGYCNFLVDRNEIQNQPGEAGDSGSGGGSRENPDNGPLREPLHAISALTSVLASASASVHSQHSQTSADGRDKNKYNSVSSVKDVDGDDGNSVGSSDGGSAAGEADEKLSLRETAWLSLEFCLLWFAANYFAVACLEYTSVASATIFTSLSGVFTLLLGALARIERFSLRKLFGVLTSLAGVALVSSIDVSSSSSSSSESAGGTDGRQGQFPHKTAAEIATGDAMALLSAVIYGAYVTVMKRRIGNENRVDMSLFFGLVGLFNVLFLWPGLVLLHVTSIERFELPPNSQVWTIILLNSFSSFLSDLTWAYAMLLTTPLIVTVGLSLTIPVSIVGEMFQYGRYASGSYWIGACIVVFSFLFINHESREAGEEERPISEHEA